MLYVKCVGLEDNFYKNLSGMEMYDTHEEETGILQNYNFCGGSACASGWKHCDRMVLVPKNLAGGHHPNNLIPTVCYYTLLNISNGQTLPKLIN